MITKNQTKKRTSLTRLFLCLTALIMLWTTGAQAQTTVTIGSGTGTSTY
ncbi:MAG: hypothetical protein IPJ93_09960 [Bacteroidota bacterium]|nr:MAG: hypothetical protein IPJ93_09960 [Bacteroidota bacterium]